MLRPIALALLLAAPAALCADLLTRYFPGKTEADVAKDFETNLPTFLKERLKDPEKPRIQHTVNKREVWLELQDVTPNDLLFLQMERHGLYPDLGTFGYAVSETEVRLKLADIPPAVLARARCMDYRFRTIEETVALAFWLASRGDLAAANYEIAPLALKNSLVKPDIEAWLIGKYGWPAGSALDAVEVHDLEDNIDGTLLLTKEANAQRLKDLDKEAKDVLKALQTAQGGDLKGKPGARKNPPTMRLDHLKSRLERYGKAYGGTLTAENKATKKMLEDLLAAVKADLDWVETQGYKADRLAIDGDIQACADMWLVILKADPHTFQVIQKAADACTKAAGLVDNGRKCDRKDRALRAAQLWEEYSRLQPLYLAPYNNAGLNYMAAGEKAKAKACFEEVIRRTTKKELPEGEKAHRDYAEARLKDLR
jgi:hypothetical protein